MTAIKNSFEIWKPVQTWVGFYEVSNQGRVRSCDRVAKGRYEQMKFKGRILKPGTHPKGYLLVSFTKVQCREYHFVHALVAAAFIGPRPAGYEVRHLDGNPKNNAATNLAYGTRKENGQDRIRHGTNKTLKGHKNPLAKLCLRKVRHLRKNRPQKSLKQWALFYGVSTTTIKSVLRGRSYVETP
jgi:hypothetical protein